MTQDDVAKALGMTRSQYAYNENRAKRLSPKFIDDLSRLFHVSPRILMEGLNETPIPKANDYHHDLPDTGDMPPIITAKQKKLLNMFLLLPSKEQAEIFECVREKYKQHNVKDDES